LGHRDIDALGWAFREYSGKTFAELERITHKDIAWRNARERDGIIRYEDMLGPGSNERGRMERVSYQRPDTALRKLGRA
jgi:hypothetical protein